MKMNGKNWLKLVVALIICFGSARLSGFLSSFGSRQWYDALVQPSWAPPNIAFPIAWTIIFFFMSFSLWIVWVKGAKPSAYWAFGIQLFLNFIWMPLFFWAECITCGLVDSALLWIAIWVNMLLFAKTSRLAAWLLLPYLLWATFAMTLIAKIYVLNV